jgi:hypothetical protein
MTNKPRGTSGPDPAAVAAAQAALSKILGH